MEQKPAASYGNLIPQSDKTYLFRTKLNYFEISKYD